MKLLSDEDEKVVLNFITSEFSLVDFINIPAFNLNEVHIKKPHLCPNCGKMLSGLTSYRRHLVGRFYYT